MSTNCAAWGLLVSLFATMLPMSIEKSIGSTTKTITSSPGICQLPEKSGSCMAYKTRWYYNGKVQKCQQFVYGGCEGNQNNFLTKGACMLACGSVAQQGLKPTITTTSSTIIEARKRVGNGTQSVQNHPPTSNKPCEVEKRKALLSNALGVFVPECNRKGFYKPKQCRTPLGLQRRRCWCVNRKGNKIGEVTKLPNGKETCKPLNTKKPSVIPGGGLCGQILYIYSTLKKSEMSNLLIPQCDDAGNFISLQCDRNNCWCVDIVLGEIIPKSHGKKGSVKCTKT